MYKFSTRPDYFTFMCVGVYVAGHGPSVRLFSDEPRSEAMSGLSVISLGVLLSVPFPLENNFRKLILGLCMITSPPIFSVATGE